MQWAAPALLGLRAQLQRQILGRVRANRAFLASQIGPTSPWKLLATEGGWYAVLEAPRIQSEEEWVLSLLTEDGVLVQPGFFFDFEREAFLVISLLTPEDVFREGVRRILTRLRRYAGFRISASVAADAIRALASSISFSQQPLIEMVISRSESPVEVQARRLVMLGTAHAAQLFFGGLLKPLDAHAVEVRHLTNILASVCYKQETAILFRRCRSGNRRPFRPRLSEAVPESALGWKKRRK